MGYYFAIIERVELFFQKKYTGGVAVSPEVDVTARKDGGIALFLARST